MKTVHAEVPIQTFSCKWSGKNVATLNRENMMENQFSNFAGNFSDRTSKNHNCLHSLSQLTCQPLSKHIEYSIHNFRHNNYNIKKIGRSSDHCPRVPKIHFNNYH